ncbi:hypothetical protein [Methylomonas sp. Kb3]|uniref:hypothetical protein n=1 Tax=Methylomonas sp. Kb3 TaxID=1611544 RepID=UPI00105441A6|nr:hypothetical protein [Methylomonas sp. Kb3]
MFISALLSIYSQNSQSNTNQTENTLITPATTDLSTISHKIVKPDVQKIDATQATPTPLYLASDCNVVLVGGNQYEYCFDYER